MRWTTRTTCQDWEGCTGDPHKRPILLNPQTEAWVRPSGKALGRLIPSHPAALNPSSWNRGQRLARPVDHRECPPVALLETPPATLLSYSASSSWTVASLCRGASPWHTHPGSVSNQKLIVVRIYKTGEVVVAHGWEKFILKAEIQSSSSLYQVFVSIWPSVTWVNSSKCICFRGW